MNTLTSSTTNQSFGRVHTLLLRVVVSPLSNLNLMLKNRVVQIIKKNADFGGIENHGYSPPVPHHRQLEYQCGGSTPEV
jgi:hypothetical protein